MGDEGLESNRSSWFFLFIEEQTKADIVEIDAALVQTPSETPFPARRLFNGCLTAPRPSRLGRQEADKVSGSW